MLGRGLIFKHSAKFLLIFLALYVVFELKTFIVYHLDLPLYTTIFTVDAIIRSLLLISYKKIKIFDF